MAIKVEFREELAIAFGARETFFPVVYLQVLIEIRLLGEALAAFWHIAKIRSLLGVDSKMVKEVVPFPENFATTVVQTIKQSNDPLRILAPMNIYTVFFRIGYMLLYTNLT